MAETIGFLLMAGLIIFVLLKLFFFSPSSSTNAHFTKEGPNCDFHQWDDVVLFDPNTLNSEEQKICIKCGYIPAKQKFLSSSLLKAVNYNIKVMGIIKTIREEMKDKIALDTGLSEKTINKIVDTSEKFGRASYIVKKEAEGLRVPPEELEGILRGVLKQGREPELPDESES